MKKIYTCVPLSSLCLIFSMLTLFHTALVLLDPPRPPIKGDNPDVEAWSPQEYRELVQVVVEENGLDTFLILCLCPLNKVGNLIAELRPVGARTNFVYSGVLHVAHGGVLAHQSECLGVVAFWRSRQPNLHVYSDLDTQPKGLFFNCVAPTHDLITAPDGLVIDPTQLPEEFCAALVNRFSKPGETILDLCSGSGVFAVAGLMRGRNVVAFEPVEKKYCSILSLVTKSLSTPLDEEDVNPSQEIDTSQGSAAVGKVITLSPYHPAYPCDIDQGNPDPKKYACCGVDIPMTSYVVFQCVGCSRLFHGGPVEIGTVMLCSNRPIYYEGILPFCSIAHRQVIFQNLTPFLYFTFFLVFFPSLFFSHPSYFQPSSNPFYLVSHSPNPSSIFSCVCKIGI